MDQQHWSGSFHDATCEFPTSGPVRIYDLGHALKAGMPRHPAHPPYSFSLTKQHGEVMFPNDVSAASESITTGGHTGTHVDALGHVSQHGKIFGGRSILDCQSYAGGLGVGSTEELPPLIGTGHLVDGVRIKGRPMEGAEEIDAGDLAAWFADRREPAPGSIVLVRTGWTRHYDDLRAYLGTETGLPGVTLDGAEWLSERGVMAVGSDTIVFEKTEPNPPAYILPVHLHLLVEKGIPIMEGLNLEPVGADGVTDFTFIAVPLRIQGGTGSPIRPVAVVAR